MSSVAVVPMDIHKKFSKVVLMDAEAQVLAEGTVGHEDPEELILFFASLPEGTEVVMEATFNWPWIADLAQEVGLHPHLAHSLRAREMAKGMAKSDRRDAVWLGRLFLADTIFPGCYLAPPEVRAMRALFRFRMLVVRMRTQIKNCVHGQLHRRGILIEEVADLFGSPGRSVLARLRLPDSERADLERKLAVLDDLQVHIDRLETRMQAQLKQDPRAEILMSLPGVGNLTAYGMLAEIGQIERFPNGRALAAYAGVLPLENESAGKQLCPKRTGMRCNRILRYVAIEAVTGAIRSSPQMAGLHARVRRRNPRAAGKARVAVARHLMELVWLLWTRGEFYREPPARSEGTGRKRRTKPTIPHRVSQTELSATPGTGEAAL